MRRAAVLFAWASACTSASETPPVPVAATATAIDERTVEVLFTEALEASSVDPRAMRVFAPFARPARTLAVEDATVRGELLTVHTAPQSGGKDYTLELGPLRFVQHEQVDVTRQVVFVGFGRAEVTLSLDLTGFVVPADVALEATVDPGSGEYQDALARLPFERQGDTFTRTLGVRASPGRTFAARAVGPTGQEASELLTFGVSSTTAQALALAPRGERLPEFDLPVDRRVGDGLAPIRLILDDRPGRALVRPTLRSSLDGAGRFDPQAVRVDTPARLPGQRRVWELLLEVAVDPARRLDGTTVADFPYVITLIEDGEEVPQRGATFVTPDERPQTVVVFIGNPALVPVTFRVDAGAAILEPDPARRGRYPGEGIFLTGELPSAEDALGRLAADAFSGGERAALELKERRDAPGIFEKTVFMPPDRPYGWKVVRCPTGQGCAELNRHVLSSGRAFPTVMKNLVTANVDAARSPATRLIDPAHLDRVELENGALADYARARVSTDGREAPGPSVMFKQESPDLVVTVGRTPLTTPIVVVGTWRDVNIPATPEEIIRSGSTLELSPFDYDDGTQGRAPLVRALTLPEDPGD